MRIYIYIYRSIGRSSNSPVSIIYTCIYAHYIYMYICDIIYTCIYAPYMYMYICEHYLYIQDYWMPCIVASFAAQLQYTYTYIYTGLLDALYCSSAASEAIPATARSVLRVLRPGLFFFLFHAKKQIQKSSHIIDH